MTKQTEIPRTLKGRVASSGIVSGIAFRWEPGEALKKMQEGAILVTKMTTVEIMPVIKKLGGVVTEIGGITCHAAIVAREFGFPAVVACKGADGIMSGDMVTVDGERGEVVIVNGKDRDNDEA